MTMPRFRRPLNGGLRSSMGRISGAFATGPYPACSTGKRRPTETMEPRGRPFGLLRLFAVQVLDDGVHHQVVE